MTMDAHNDYTCYEDGGNIGGGCIETNRSCKTDHICVVVGDSDGGCQNLCYLIPIISRRRYRYSSLFKHVKAVVVIENSIDPPKDIFSSYSAG